MKLKLLLITVVILLLGMGGYYTIQNSEEEVSYGENVSRIKERRVLLVGTDPTYPPMEDVSKSGQIVGFDIDLASEIASDLGVELEVKQYNWDEIFDALDNSEVDMVLSSVTINKERAAKWLFSSPYLNAGQVILAKSGRTDLKSIKDLADKSLAVLVDTTSYDEALKYVPIENIKTHTTFDEVMEALMADEAEVTIVDLPIAVEITKSNSLYKIYGEPVTQEFYGVVMRKNENDLVKFVNSTIGSIKRNGKLQEIEGSWLK